MNTVVLTLGGWARLLVDLDEVKMATTSHHVKEVEGPEGSKAVHREFTGKGSILLEFDNRRAFRWLAEDEEIPA